MFTNIPSATLRQLVKLSERKEALMAQIQDIDREMLALQSKHEAPALSGAKRAPVTVSPAPQASRRPRAQRGALKEKILKALKSAGAKGIGIAELSKKLGTPSGNLYVWFNGTGRNVRGIKKIGVARYQLR